MEDSEIIDRIDKRFEELTAKIDLLIKDKNITHELLTEKYSKLHTTIERVKVQVKIYSLLTGVAITGVLGIHFGFI